MTKSITQSTIEYLNKYPKLLTLNDCNPFILTSLYLYATHESNDLHPPLEKILFTSAAFIIDLSTPPAALIYRGLKTVYNVLPDSTTFRAIP